MMTNISKQSLPIHLKKQLYAQFTKLFVSANERKLAALFDVVFTESEKIMFIKRIAIILMLSRGVSIYAIAKSLKVTEVTVRTHRDKFLVGDYQVITGIIKQKSFNINDFIRLAEILLQAGMPNYGRGRWKSLEVKKPRY